MLILMLQYKNVSVNYLLDKDSQYFNSMKKQEQKQMKNGRYN